MRVWNARRAMQILRELNFLLHKKERPGVFTRPNLHKTPTRLRLLGHNRERILCETMTNCQHFRTHADEKSIGSAATALTYRGRTQSSSTMPRTRDIIECMPQRRDAL